MSTIVGPFALFVFIIVLSVLQINAFDYSLVSPNMSYNVLFYFPLVGISRCRCKRHDNNWNIAKVGDNHQPINNQSVDIKQNILSKMIRKVWRCRGVIGNCKSVNHRSVRIMVMVFNTTFNNISVILWLWIVFVEETGWSGENHRPAVSYWQTLSHTSVSSTPVQTDAVYSTSSLKQQSADRHVAPLGHNILIPSQQVFALST